MYYNIGIVSKNQWKLHATWSFQTTLLIICRHSKFRRELSYYLKRFMMDTKYLPTLWWWRADSLWWWRADSCHLLCYRRGFTFNTVVSCKCIWCEKCVAARDYADIGMQLLISNDRNRVRWVVFCLSQDGACTDLFDATTFNPLFSLSIPSKYYMRWFQCKYHKMSSENCSGDTKIKHEDFFSIAA